MFEIEEEISDPLEPAESASTTTTENPFRFTISRSNSTNSLSIEIDDEPMDTHSPTAVQVRISQWFQQQHASKNPRNRVGKRACLSTLSSQGILAHSVM